MQIDSFYSIGQSHRVCQDYCLHNDNQVILCDGCSTAAFSDTGSRLLAHSVLNYPTYSYEWVLEYAWQAAKKIKLNTESLSATILTVEVENDKIVCKMIGDGVLVSRKRDSGELELFSVEFASGAPWYLKYLLDNMKNRYLEQFGDAYSINGECQPNGFFSDYPNGVIEKTFPTETYDLVAIFSDGLNSFQQKTPTSWTPFPMENVLKELLSFKGYAGSFVQRRCNKGLAKLRELGVTHSDDFSMGVIKV